MIPLTKAEIAVVEIEAAMQDLKRAKALIESSELLPRSESEYLTGISQIHKAIKTLEVIEYHFVSIF